MYCYFSRHYNNLKNAGNKAKTDIEAICSKQGFINIGIKQTVGKNKITGFFLTLYSILKASYKLQKKDILLIQYPLKKYYSFICIIAKLKGAKTITLIHDLGSFRRKKLTIPKEIKRLNRSNYIIAHNTAMKKWLQQHGIKRPVGCLEIFDYLSQQYTPSRTSAPYPYTVVYAGGLSPRKNKFLYEVGEYITNYQINLYGNGFEPDQAKSKEYFICKGFLPSDELISQVEGEFGLVWDGDSVNACAGDWGHYLKYNNPHKTSLYIRCELPIIIWNKAALASFVKENRIGICIDNLDELNDVLQNLSQKKINELKMNVAIISKRLAKGYYTQKAIGAAIQNLELSE